jgi:hypothetical protein
MVDRNAWLKEWEEEPEELIDPEWLLFLWECEELEQEWWEEYKEFVR